MNLYEITGALVQIQDTLDNDDLTPEQRAEGEALAGEILAGLLPDKVAGYCGFLRSLKLEAEAFKTEEKRLADRRKVREGIAERLTTRLQGALSGAGVRKLTAGVWSLTLQANPPAVDVLDELLIPSAFWLPQPSKLDRRALGVALKGGEVPGARLTQGESLRIK